ncbi:hypothetical protein ACK249_003761 [Pseudomonas aeruginosa]|jgi:uncharacterized protein (UPF0147 family)|nr:hypothetical protein [Pseudomonas aeruginosa]EKX3429490.1 hypothetical protein [Pseudomonas aeruginosa]NRC33986.1 hypothetical protein [Pseudomonas aeruginosa]CAI9794634.1 DUF2281 domain-containing protein [Pseudomonas aeruginosa]CAI9912023.1 DUF2281 domain-containing protein [Pseudomonas aeruginosa]HBO1617648.1 hypothetical protein [Pseudomonas aeruginosa]
MMRMTYDQIIDAIRNLYSDTSVPRSVTKDDLEQIQEEVETLLDTLKDA